MMASLEGRRGVPRRRLIHLSEHGPLGPAHQPQQRRDLGQRARTSCSRAPTGSASIGTEGSTGTKIFSLVGKVEQHRPRRGADGHDPARDRLRRRRRHPRRQGVQGRPDRRPVRRLPAGGQARRAGGLRHARGRGLHDGLRRHDRHGRGHLHGGRRQVLPALPRLGVVRQLHLVPRRARHACTTCSATSPRAAARGRPSPSSRSSPTRWRPPRSAPSARAPSTRCCPRCATSATSTSRTWTTSAARRGCARRSSASASTRSAATAARSCAVRCPQDAVTGEKKQPHTIDAGALHQVRHLQGRLQARRRAGAVGGRRGR